MWICSYCGKWHYDDLCPDCQSSDKIDSDTFFEKELEKNNIYNFPKGDLYYIEQNS